MKNFERVDRKDEERSESKEKCKGYGSATESESEASEVVLSIQLKKLIPVNKIQMLQMRRKG